MADSPKQAEAAQALFSAIVDYRGAPLPYTIDNYIEFQEQYKREIRAVKRAFIVKIGLYLLIRQ